jgi:proteasome accessory factor A
VQIELDEPPGFMLPNGARFYLDHTHPEWSTPECSAPLEAVIYDKVGEVWLHEALNRINTERAPERRLTAYKNNVDAYGNTYGCHENYLMDAATYAALFDGQAHRLYTTLIPFLVTRQIFCGAGKIAPSGGGDDVGFCISQRADFFESLIGLQTTYRRPIINTRDEPHADPLRFRRLHVIVGDANLAEFSTYLKVGTMALLLEMLADDRLRLDLTLAHPLHALRAISRDPTCQQTIELETGYRRYRAVDVQRCFVDAAGRYLDERGDRSFRRQVWEAWSQAVDDLAREPASLAAKLDWVIKHEFLQAQMEARGWTWADLQVRALDFKYHLLDPQRGLFYVLQREGLIERLISDDQIEWARDHPPRATRAKLRIQCLERFVDHVAAVNWDTLVFRGRDNVATFRWRWTDPAFGGDEETDRLLEGAADPQSFAQAVLERQMKTERLHNGSQTDPGANALSEPADDRRWPQGRTGNDDGPPEAPGPGAG